MLKLIALQFVFIEALALFPGVKRSRILVFGMTSLSCLWLAGLYAVFLVSPAPGARREGDVLVIRVTAWKRLALPTVISLPGWFLVLTRFYTDPGVGWFVAMLVALMVALFWSTRDQFHVTEWGVARAVVGLGPKQKIGWGEVTRIGLWPAGITLGAPGKPTVSLYGIMLDGYPELVREVLLKIPHVVDATPKARERLERVAALAPRNAGGADSPLT